MRAGPDNGADVITVVAAGATVDVVACNFWCEVIYNGRTGWIYQDFLIGAPR
jgi:SH3-like domain-containing protein